MKEIKYEYKMQNIGKKYRELIRNKFDRKKIKNKDYTILCNTCIGGVIYHDLNHEFLTPTINLYITASSFCKILRKFRLLFRVTN